MGKSIPLVSQLWAGGGAGRAESASKKDKIITSFGAEVGDKVIVAIDLDGKPHEMFSLNWDTTYDKDAKIVQDQITAVQYLAENDYINLINNIDTYTNDLEVFKKESKWYRGGDGSVDFSAFKNINKT